LKRAWLAVPKALQGVDNTEVAERRQSNTHARRYRDQSEAARWGSRRRSGLIHRNKAITGVVCLLDVLRAHESGVQNVVCSLTEISCLQIEMLAALMVTKRCDTVELL
jgi:hypothetical protein